MSTTFPITVPHAPTGSVNQAALDLAFTTPINDLYALLATVLADTGWQGVASLQTGWTNDSVPLQSRQIGPYVFLKGGLINATFNTSTFTLAATLNSSVAAPTATNVFHIARSSATVSSEARVLSDRSVQVLTSAAAGSAFRFDGLCYLAN